MPKVLLLCVHRPNRSPSQRFRIEQYLSYLSSHGYEFEFSYLLDARDDTHFYKRGKFWQKALVVLRGLGKRISQTWKWKQYDLVFVQREGIMVGTAFLELFLARRLPLIYDFDDSIWIPNISEANACFAFLKTTHKIRQMIQAAALVFAGNPYLADYAGNFNSKVRVVPTTIDTDLYQPQGNSDRPGPVCIGWSGSFSTVQHFKLAIPALMRIKELYGSRVCFKIIGDADYFCQELDTQGCAWRAETEVFDLLELDIGLMPLPDDEWARGKCGLKGLQYMALGIPTLMSPVGVNTQIIENGVNGYLPTTTEDWVETLSHLVDSVQERRRIGQAGRQTVIDSFSVQRWQQTYLELFNSLIRS